MARKKKNNGKWKKILIAFSAVLLLSVAVLSFEFYQRFTEPNISLPEGEEEGYLYIPTGSDFNTLINIVDKSKLVKSIETFKWVASQMNLDEHIHPGRYKVERGMSNLQLVRILYSGKQTPVRLVLNKFRTKEQLSSFVCNKLELDSTLLLSSLNDEVYLENLGFNPDNSLLMFIPNTHEFYWNTSLDKFIERIKENYDHFWNETNKDKAKQIGLTPLEVGILASIIEEETNANDEKPTIASVYLNRLKKDMLLQADPTVKFAWKRFDIRRVLKVHTEKRSPYNTYMFKGLPPGPICTPSESSIKAVLNSAETNYLFFCADADRPGRHTFAVNYVQHLKNASRYQKSLNQRNIFE